MNMIRKLLHVTAPQAEWLEQEAKRLGISVSELVRRIIDEARGEK